MTWRRRRAIIRAKSLCSVVRREIGRYPFGVRSALVFGRQTMMPCFCSGVIFFCVETSDPLAQVGPVL